MPKIKMPRSSPSLDMTPMVDLAFLLVTFFMLTTKFRAPEPVVVDTPSSTSNIILPENVMMITIDTVGRVYFDITGKEVRKTMLESMAAKYNIGFTEKEIERFQVMSMFGMPMSDLRRYINAEESQRQKLDAVSRGIPVDSANNELANWIMEGYRAASIDLANRGVNLKIDKDKALRFAIKADGDTHYDKVKKVINTFKEREIYRFNLITNLESEPGS